MTLVVREEVCTSSYLRMKLFRWTVVQVGVSEGKEERG